MRKHLVVTRYAADVSWLDRCRGFDRTFLYDKGPSPLPGAIPLPNVGIDTHTHLHHIVAHYEDLPELLVLCQDHPFDHSPNFLDVINHDGLSGMWAENLRRFPQSQAYAQGFVGVGDYRLISKDLIYSDPNVKDDPAKVAFHLHKYQLIEAIWALAFPGRDLPAIFPSTWGSQLILSKERIRVNPRVLYKSILDLHLSDRLVPYALENLWWFLLRCDTEDAYDQARGGHAGPIQRDETPS